MTLIRFVLFFLLVFFYLFVDRLEFSEFNTTRPLDRGICNIDQFIIMNSLDGAAFPRCGELTGYSSKMSCNVKKYIEINGRENY